jgi:hypothetical protein
MERYARGLFGISALFNLSVAAGLTLFRPQLAPLLGLAPVAGANAAIFDVAGALVAVFGYAYWRAGQDPVRYRPYIELGLIGKLVVVAVVTASWLAGNIDWRLPGLASGDLLFAALFADFLRRTRGQPGISRGQET